MEKNVEDLKRKANPGKKLINQRKNEEGKNESYFWTDS